MGGSATKMTEVEKVQQELDKNIIVVFSGTRCPWCYRLKDLLHASGLSHLTHTILLDRVPEGNELAHGLNLLTRQRTIPNVFIGGVHVGGYSEVEHLLHTGELETMINAVKSRKAAEKN
eukprot:TRINITY_DN20162_c0_g1_i1.p1 TRINITY_DN20162_c0_g1~~TRINITY_DN20162_c0_g1_i1.p1  ORF type:complete len:119 (+),score=27.17 TRINITY_DN20162_c0_g1_i1:48-404(+)